MKAIMLALGIPFAVVILIGGAMSGSDAASGQAVDIAAVPAAARPWLPDLESERSQVCPELPLVWLVAEIQAESGWNPRAYSPVGAAGLLQMMPATWTTAGGGAGWDPASRPPPDHPVWSPPRHFAVALAWMCTNLRQMSAHLASTGKTTSPLDAMAVCHIAGCSRVTGSATGTPTAGEAGCGTACADAVHAYLAAIHGYVDRYSAPGPTSGMAAGRAGGVAAFTGASPGCTVPDPTGTGGCITPATAWLLTQVTATFGRLPATCWDAHAWNPTSDHPKGKACDFTFGTAGQFPGPADTARGWQLASWLTANAGPLQVAYVIWQGHIWSTAHADQGWRTYTGGGVYDPHEPTGGHYDHIHVSVTE